MVKKIDGGPRPANGSHPIQSSGAVEGTRVENISGVQGTATSSGAGRVRKATRPITAEERAVLFQMINEEADKLFAQHQLPEEQRAVVEGAVKMAVEGAIVDEED